VIALPLSESSLFVLKNLVMLLKKRYQRLIPYLLVFGAVLINTAQQVDASEEKASNNSGIVSTNLCIDTLAVALIGAENLLAVSSVADDKKYSTIADKIKNTKKTSFNAEEIYSLNPSMVIASNFSSLKTRRALAKLGIKVELIEYAQSIDDLKRNINRMGTLLRATEKAKNLIQKFEEFPALVGLETNRTALQYSANKYLNGENSLINDIFLRAGFKRPQDLKKSPGGQFLSSEIILKAKPDLLLLDREQNSAPEDQNPAYHRSIYSPLAGLLTTHVSQKYWSCGAPEIIHLIKALAKINIDHETKE
jgi:ABC-type Fe3+-hydroxamate transport system substrate-binding protein